MYRVKLPNTRTQTTSRNLLLQTYTYAAELATWGVGPDVILHIKSYKLMGILRAHTGAIGCTVLKFVVLACAQVKKHWFEQQ